MRKAFAFLCFSIVARAVAASEGGDRHLGTVEEFIGGGSRSEIGLIPNKQGRSRELKGSKGKGGGKGNPPPLPPGSSKGSKGGSACERFDVYFSNNDFKDSFEGDGLIGTNQVKLYHQGGHRAGSYIEVTTGIGPKDCYSNGVYTLETGSNGHPTSQIFVSATCYASSQAITGGIGEYACAKGYVYLSDAGASTRDNRVISVCSSGCN